MSNKIQFSLNTSTISDEYELRLSGNEFGEIWFSLTPDELLNLYTVIDNKLKEDKIPNHRVK